MAPSGRTRTTLVVSLVASVTGAVPSAVVHAWSDPADEEVDPDLLSAQDGGAPQTTAAVPSASTASPVVVRNGMVRVPSGQLHPAAMHGAAPIVVPEFWIDRTEVTVEAYRACVNAGDCSRPAQSSASCTYDLAERDLPVSCVHWADADAYCRFAHARLPTEAEWERAARASVTLAYPWGASTSCAYANTMTGVFIDVRPCAKQPSPVGTHPLGASPFGVQDVVGNVEEWTADWYADSTNAFAAAPQAGAAHVLRGGGWLSTQAMSRLGTRDWASSMEAGPNVGFRCARSD